MKKIMLVTRNMKAGGAERVISELAGYFVKIGYECTIITLDKEEIFYKLHENIKVYDIGIKSSNGYIDKFLKYKELRCIVITKRPDIVLALPEDIGIYVIPALMGTKIPVVVSERNNPWVMPWKKSTRLLRKVSYPFASGFIFQTQLAASFFSKRIQRKGIVLPNPLNLERIPKAFEGKIRKEVVGAGRLDKQKNFKLLIEAFSKFYKIYPNYVLTIYGEGSLREELINYAKSLLPKASYSFPGRATDLLERISGATMFVLTSNYEGMPNVIIEAMAMGMPVIATDCPSGGLAYLIENEKNGLLVPVGNVEAISEAMQKVAESENFAVKLSNNAQNIKERLDADLIIEKWRVYLERIISYN